MYSSFSAASDRAKVRSAAAAPADATPGAARPRTLCLFIAEAAGLIIVDAIRLSASEAHEALEAHAALLQLRAAAARQATPFMICRTLEKKKLEIKSIVFAMIWQGAAMRKREAVQYVGQRRFISHSLLFAQSLVWVEA